MNEFVKRIRAFKIHLLIISHLKKQLPHMFGKKVAYDKLLCNLQSNFDAVSSNFITYCNFIYL